MKIALLISVLFLFIFLACSDNGSKNMKSAIPGTYVRVSDHEYGKEYDTLVIVEKVDQFQITRKWKYERILDGVMQEPEYKQEITTASYDSKQQLLHENESGNVISYDSKENAVSVGSTKYQKLK